MCACRGHRARLERPRQRRELRDALRGETDFLARYRREVVGAAVHAELWVPAEALDAFNAHIVGLIEVIARFPP
jgi:hypothetical protein